MRIDDACEGRKVPNVEQGTNQTDLDRWDDEGGYIPPDELNAFLKMRTDPNGYSRRE